MPSPRHGSTIIPTLSYRDAPAMIDWLERAFGFHKQAVYMDGDVVLHAQLTFGSGMVMLGSANKDGDWARLMAQPDEIGGRSTHGVCVVVDDADADALDGVGMIVQQVHAHALPSSDHGS